MSENRVLEDFYGKTGASEEAIAATDSKKRDFSNISTEESPVTKKQASDSQLTSPSSDTPPAWAEAIISALRKITVRTDTLSGKVFI